MAPFCTKYWDSIFIIIMNTVMIHTLQRRSQWVTSTSQGEGQGQIEGQIQGQSAKSSDRQIFTTLLLVTFSFLILSTPFYAVHLWVNFTNGSGPQFIATYQFCILPLKHCFSQIMELISFTMSCLERSSEEIKWTYYPAPGKNNHKMAALPVLVIQSTLYVGLTVLICRRDRLLSLHWNCRT